MPGDGFCKRNQGISEAAIRLGNLYKTMEINKRRCPMKKVSFIMACMTLVVLTAQPVFAESAFTVQRDVAYLEDGSCLVTTIKTSPCEAPSQAASSYRSSLSSASPPVVKRMNASKQVEYRSPAGKALWYLKLTGSFSYNGETAVCLQANAVAKSKVSSWKVSHKRAWKSRRKVRKNGKAVWTSGNRAYASATGKRYRSGKAVCSIPRQVSLTCSPSGKIR